MLAALRRLLTESPGKGDLPEVHVSSSENPSSLSAFRGPAGGTLSGLGPSDPVAGESAPKEKPES